MLRFVNADQARHLATEEFLVRGIRDSHDPRVRLDFLGQVFIRLEEVLEWSEALSKRHQLEFIPNAPPVFLHGGPSEGKVGILGINPGWDGADASPERVFPTIVRDYYVIDEHLRYFDRVRRSPGRYWTRASGILADFMGVSRPRSSAEIWTFLSANCVGQDLIPFHSTCDKMGGLISSHPSLRAMADATIESIAKSELRLAFAFGKEPFFVLAGHPNVRVIATDSIEVTSRMGRPATVHLQFSRIGSVPVLSVDRFLLGQGLPCPLVQLLPRLWDFVAGNGVSRS